MFLKFIPVILHVKGITGKVVVTFTMRITNESL